MAISIRPSRFRFTIAPCRLAPRVTETSTRTIAWCSTSPVVSSTGFHYDTALSYAQSSTDFNLEHGFLDQNATVGTDAAGNPVYAPNSLQYQINQGNYNPFTTNLTDSERRYC